MNHHPTTKVQQQNQLLQSNHLYCQPTEIKTDNPTQFIEANTCEVSMEHLKNECIIPVFSKDNEVTISHNDFVSSTYETVCKLFPNEQILEPQIRVSHIVKGRVPEAIHKSVNDLCESDKTIYYERMAFCIEIPSITDTINGNKLNLTIGGVRAVNATDFTNGLCNVIEGLPNYKWFLE